MDPGASLPIKLQPSNIRPIAYRILSKKHGLNIKTEALAALTAAISHRFGSEWKGPKCQQFIEEIARAWKAEDRGIFIDGTGLKQVLKEYSKKNSSEERDEPMVAHRSDTVMDAPEEQAINWKDYFTVINPDQQPAFKFDRHRKQFSLAPPTTNKLAHHLDATIELFYNRYNLIADRLSRHDNFQKNNNGSISLSRLSAKSAGGSNEISLVKNVLGRDGAKFILFGLLAKNANDDYILEDATDYIELNLSQTHKSEGSFYCVGMFVVVEGIYSASGGNSNNIKDYIGGCLHVSVMGHPPAERRDVSWENYGNLDFLGIHKDFKASASADKVLKVNKAWRKQLVAVEKTLTDHKLCILGSECHLDSFRVVEGLKKLFQKLENSLVENVDSAPLAIMLIGSFMSRPLTATNSSVSSISNSENYKSNFDNLAHILTNYPKLIKSSKFILIPGKNDPWQTTYSLGSSNLNYLPQKSIPNVFINRLEKMLPKGNLILGWNPLRINYLSQEIVVLKDDLMSKFKRNDIVFDHDLQMEELSLKKEKAQNEEERINNLVNENDGQVHIPEKIKQARKLVKTLLDQGNLQPFLRNVKLTDSTLDHAMRIEPLPSVIILHDGGVESFEVTYNGCKVINVGRLMAGGHRSVNYAEYYPATRKFEFKQVYF